MLRNYGDGNVVAALPIGWVRCTTLRNAYSVQSEGSLTLRSRHEAGVVGVTYKPVYRLLRIRVPYNLMYKNAYVRIRYISKKGLIYL